MLYSLANLAFCVLFACLDLIVFKRTSLGLVCGWFMLGLATYWSIRLFVKWQNGSVRNV